MANLLDRHIDETCGESENKTFAWTESVLVDTWGSVSAQRTEPVGQTKSSVESAAGKANDIFGKIEIAFDHEKGQESFNYQNDRAESLNFTSQRHEVGPWWRQPEKKLGMDLANDLINGDQQSFQQHLKQWKENWKNWTPEQRQKAIEAMEITFGNALADAIKETGPNNNKLAMIENNMRLSGLPIDIQKVHRYMQDALN